MPWPILGTPEFVRWWNRLRSEEQISVDAVLRVLEERGPLLGRPYADTLKGSKVSNLKELRIDHEGRAFRVLFAFDPLQRAILLLGGDKSGDPRWYDRNISRAESLFLQHLESLQKGGKKK